MAGYFELVDAPDGGYSIRMMDGAGQLMAVSVTFPTKRAAVAGVAQAREIAGTGLIRDRSADGQARRARLVRPGDQGTAGGAGRATSAVRRLVGRGKAGARPPLSGPPLREMTLRRNVAAGHCREMRTRHTLAG